MKRRRGHVNLHPYAVVSVGGGARLLNVKPRNLRLLPALDPHASTHPMEAGDKAAKAVLPGGEGGGYKVESVAVAEAPAHAQKAPDGYPKLVTNMVRRCRLTPPSG